MIVFPSFFVAFSTLISISCAMGPSGQSRFGGVSTIADDFNSPDRIRSLSDGEFRKHFWISRNFVL